MNIHKLSDSGLYSIFNWSSPLVKKKKIRYTIVYGQQWIRRSVACTSVVVVVCCLAIFFFFFFFTVNFACFPRTRCFHIDLHLFIVEPFTACFAVLVWSLLKALRLNIVTYVHVFLVLIDSLQSYNISFVLFKLINIQLILCFCFDLHQL